MADIVSLFGDRPVADTRAELERFDASLKAVIQEAIDAGLPHGFIVSMLMVHVHRETAHLAGDA